MNHFFIASNRPNLPAPVLRQASQNVQGIFGGTTLLITNQIGKPGGRKEGRKERGAEELPSLPDEARQRQAKISDIVTSYGRCTGD